MSKRDEALTGEGVERGRRRFASGSDEACQFVLRDVYDAAAGIVARVQTSKLLQVIDQPFLDVAVAEMFDLPFQFVFAEQEMLHQQAPNFGPALAEPVEGIGRDRVG